MTELPRPEERIDMHAYLSNYKGVRFVEGDILDYADKGIIVHQGNAVTSHAKGLALEIFTRFPWANTYKLHAHRQEGTYILHQNEETGESVACIIGQTMQGGINPRLSYAVAARELRRTYFSEALVKLLRATKETLYLPYKIGCGLAGGKWDKYLAIIRYLGTRKIWRKRIVIVKRPQDK